MTNKQIPRTKIDARDYFSKRHTLISERPHNNMEMCKEGIIGLLSVNAFLNDIASLRSVNPWPLGERIIEKIEYLLAIYRLERFNTTFVMTDPIFYSIVADETVKAIVYGINTEQPDITLSQKSIRTLEDPFQILMTEDNNIKYVTSYIFIQRRNFVRYKA